jgi:TonB family protein
MMSEKRPLPRLFGPYVLTRSLGSDLLGETFRAASVPDPKAPAGPLTFTLVRSFEGEAVDQKAMLPAMENAVEYLEEVRGQAVAKGTVLGIVDDVPFAAINYVPGQTLDRLLKGPKQEGVAFPIEHALLIGEKILIALEAGKAFARETGAPHGFLVPAFITVSNDGDTRVFGGGLGPGLLPSLKHEKAREQFSCYLAPEVVESGKPSVAGDVYSTASIVFECLTGKPVEPGKGEDALIGAVLALNGNPVPDDILKLLAKGLAREVARRESDITAYKKALGKLLYAGPYAPSTFNLAFFMHQTFDRQIEDERKELSDEQKTDVRGIVQAEERAEKERVAAVKAAAAAALPQPPVPTFGLETVAGPAGKKKGAPVGAIIGGLLVAGAIAGFLLLRGGDKPTQVANVIPTPAAPKPTATPVIPPTAIILGKEDPEFQKALQKQLDEELKKMQDQIKKEQDTAAKKREGDIAKAEAAAQRLKQVEEAAKSARDRADKDEAARLAKEADEARLLQESARKAAEAAVPKVREGDLVDVTQVDQPPQRTKMMLPDPPALARQRRISGTVILRVLVDENGKSSRVEVLRDTNPAVGLAEACVEAVKKWEWTPPIKEGKRVKTWVAVPIPFKL